MKKEKLYTNNGEFVVEVTTPPWQQKPELYIWGERFFLLRDDGRYTESAGAFFLPPEARVEEPKPELPSAPMPPGRATTDGKPPAEGFQDTGAPKPIDPETGQHEAYWVLPEEERAKGFVRPVRRSYRHVGPKPPGELRDLTAEERLRYEGQNYVKYETYPEEMSPKTGRYWTQAQLDSIGGCGAVTTMNRVLSETFARQPDYYGSTFCSSCVKHLPVGENGEFVWEGTNEKVGT
jgi:hypothetical protein